MKDKKYTLYEHIFPNGKRYIGVTSQNIKARWKNGFGYETQSKMMRAIQEFGWDNIEHIILQENLTEEEAHRLERKRIIEFNSIENGYNTLVGGINTSGEKLYEYNNEFLTASELAEKYGIDGVDGHTITNRVNCRGWGIERALTQEVEQRLDQHEFNGNIYSIDDIYNMRKVELTKNDIRCRLNKGWDLERIISQPKGKKKQPFGIKEPTYEYNGELYNTYQLCQLSKYDLKPIDITTRINHHGWSVKRAINTPKKNRNAQIEYNGHTYNTHGIAELNKDEKVTHHTVTDRLKNGWSIEEIINIPSGMTRKQYYKNNNN